jgi:hypothetical protein
MKSKSMNSQPEEVEALHFDDPLDDDDNVLKELLRNQRTSDNESDARHTGNTVPCFL